MNYIFVNICTFLKILQNVIFVNMLTIIIIQLLCDFYTKFIKNPKNVIFWDFYKIYYLGLLLLIIFFLFFEQNTMFKIYLHNYCV